MTASRILKLECDYPGCFNIFESRLLEAGEARRATVDWSAREEFLDFCGHHPELKQHTLTVMQTSEHWGTAYFTTACSCGWMRKEGTPRSWMKEGENGTLKDIALRDWAYHLPLELYKACQRRMATARRKKRDALNAQLFGERPSKMFPET